MKCKNCSVEIKNNKVQWVHIDIDGFYIYCSFGNQDIDGNLIATPGPIEEYETDNNFMELLKAI